MALKAIIEDAFPYTSEYAGMAENGTTPVYDRAIGSAAYREIWKTFFSDGIGDEENDFKLTLAGGFGISIGGGRFFADGVTGVINRETVLQVEAPPTDANRTDRIVIQNNYIDRYTYIYIKKGDTALIRNDEIYEIGLYDILIRVNASEIQAGNVTDLRANRSVCGKIMTSDASALVPVLDKLADQFYGIVSPGLELTYQNRALKKLIAEYKTAGTYTWEVPAGVYFIDVFLMGGGGGSPYASDTNGADAGGGGAGYIKNIIKLAVTPGQKISLVVGAGGTAGTSSSRPGGVGGTSSFNGITAGGGENGDSVTGFGSYVYYGRPGAGSSAGGQNAGNGCFYTRGLMQSSYTYGYAAGQGFAAMNINDPGRTYGRGGKTSDQATPTCDVDVGSGGDGGRTNNGTISGSAGKPGCVMIYAYIPMPDGKLGAPYTTAWTTANQYLLTIPNHPGNVEGTKYWVRFHAANTSATVNVNINGLGNVRLYKGAGTTSPAIGEITANSLWLVEYSSGAFRLAL